MQFCHCLVLRLFRMNMLDKRIEKFLEEFKQILFSMTKADFRTLVSSTQRFVDRDSVSNCVCRSLYTIALLYKCICETNNIIWASYLALNYCIRLSSHRALVVFCCVTSFFCNEVYFEYDDKLNGKKIYIYWFCIRSPGGVAGDAEAVRRHAHGGGSGEELAGSDDADLQLQPSRTDGEGAAIVDRQLL